MGDIGVVSIGDMTDEEWSEMLNGEYECLFPSSYYAHRDDCRCMVCGHRRVAYIRLRLVGEAVREQWQCEACGAIGPFRGWFE